MKLLSLGARSAVKVVRANLGFEIEVAMVGADTSIIFKCTISSRLANYSKLQQTTGYVRVKDGLEVYEIIDHMIARTSRADHKHN